MSETRLIGIATWRLVPNEPRHNTFHNALNSQALREGISLEYFGLRNNHPTNWIKQELPDTILKKFPVLSLKEFYKFKSKAYLAKRQNTVLYIFEGSVTWLLLLSLYAFLNPQLTVVCNLFSSSKYNGIVFKRDNRIRFKYKILIKFLSKMSRSVVTFDTSTMANKINFYAGTSNVDTFPVTASFPHQPIPKPKRAHHDVLVNLRTFSLTDLHRLLQGSCTKCTFTFPRGPLAQKSLEEEFSIYPNARFDKVNIPVDGYMEYFDSFDYIILLYKPSIDASGKLLDAIARRLPICIPRESSEWVSISKLWGEHYLFGWDDPQSMACSFNHPNFVKPKLSGEPSFTPARTLEAIQALHVARPPIGWLKRGIREFVVFCFLVLYTSVAKVLNVWAGLTYVLSGHLKKFLD